MKGKHSKEALTNTLREVIREEVDVYLKELKKEKKLPKGINHTIYG